ncbi:hypothetical protein PS861_00545 [Pseudomonas fluorescens]|nr:hypothetical protein PS861_00545 [Pseudomonas fluorescens]
MLLVDGVFFNIYKNAKRKYSIISITEQKMLFAYIKWR